MFVKKSGQQNPIKPHQRNSRKLFAVEQQKPWKKLYQGKGFKVVKKKGKLQITGMFEEDSSHSMTEMVYLEQESPNNNCTY